MISVYQAIYTATGFLACAGFIMIVFLCFPALRKSGSYFWYRFTQLSAFMFVDDYFFFFFFNGIVNHHVTSFPIVFFGGFTLLGVGYGDTLFRASYY